LKISANSCSSRDAAEPGEREPIDAPLV